MRRYIKEEDVLNLQKLFEDNAAYTS